MQRYSFVNLAWQALRGNRRWRPAWREPQLKTGYDVVVIGGGGHGLATAYYLAKKHGIRNVAVLERGWIGGGNSGRNTQVTRSNYFHPVSSSFYDHSLCLYERLGGELNFNVMLSQRGLVQLAHSEHDLEMNRRWCNAIRMNGVDSEMLDPQQVKDLAAPIELNGRFPVLGGFMQRRAGISRHDAVVWGYARGASALGGRYHPELRGDSVSISRTGACADSPPHVDRLRRIGRSCMSRVTRRTWRARRPALSDHDHGAPGDGNRADQARARRAVDLGDASMRMSASPIGARSSSARAPMLTTLTRNAGEFLSSDPPSRRCSRLFPTSADCDCCANGRGAWISRRTRVRLMGPTPVEGLYINCGWGTGGFKAIPAGGDTMAHTSPPDDCIR